MPVTFTPPPSVHILLDVNAPPTPASTSSYSVDSIGTGSFSGLSFSVPAHTTGTIKAKVQVMALTSNDVASLNSLIAGFLSASEKTKVENSIHAAASADLSFVGFFSGGAKASYDQTYTSMKSSGLTDDQITTIIDKFADLASNMTHVELDYTIDNTQNDYSVDGDLQLFTIAGTISSSKGTAQFRLLANKGQAAASDGSGSAPATGDVIPLQ